MRNKFAILVLMFLLLINTAWGCYYDPSSIQSTCDAYSSNTGAMVIVQCGAGPEPDTMGCSYLPGMCSGECCLEYGLPLESIKVCPEGPEQLGASGSSGSSNSNSCSAGSIIRTDQQSLSEEIYLTGIDHPIVYSSDKVKGRKAWYESRIPVTSPSFTNHPSVLSITLKVTVAGQVFSTTLPPSADLYYDFLWDGKNNLGVPVSGEYTAKVEVSENYSFAVAFPAPKKSEVILGSKLVEGTGFGGWDFSVHHFYDSTRKTLFLGDGSTFNTDYKVKTSGDIWVVSQDRSEVFVFDSNFRHIKTLNAVTGTEKLNFGYNISGKLSYIEDSYGKQITIQYTGSLVSSITSPYGHVSLVTVDSNGFISSISNSLLEKHEMTYTADGLLLTFEKPSGNISTMTYDSSGNLLSDSNASGSSITLSKLYSSATNYTITETTALGRISEHSVSNINGVITRIDTSPNWFVKNYTEDKNAKTTTKTDGASSYFYSSSQADVRFGSPLMMPEWDNTTDGGGSKTVNYSEAVSLSDPDDPFSSPTIVSTTSVNSKAYTSTYNTSTKTEVSQTPMGKTTTTVFNSKDRPVSIQNGSYTPFTFTYDSFGKLTSVTQGVSRVTTNTYSSSTGFLTSVENALGEIFSYTYDLVGRVLTKTLPDTRVVSYTYDSNGNIASITPPGRPSHQMTYNGYEFISTYVPPLLTPPSTVTSTYYYNNDRQLLQITRPDGQDIDYNYNVSTGNLDSIDLPTGSRTFTYASGILNEATSEDFYSRYFTRSGSKIMTDSISSSGIYWTSSFSYNNDHLLSGDSFTIGSSTSNISYTYNNDNFLTGAGTQVLTRSAVDGQVTQVQLGTAKEFYTYSSTYGELASLEAKYNTIYLYRESMTRDDLGRIATRTEQYGTGSADVYGYTYDLAGRLTTVTLNSLPKSSYSFDSNSNRTSQTLGAVTKTATYDDQDRLLTFGTKSFTYNINGEVATMTDSATSVTTTYTYDVMGNLKTASRTGSVVNYQVDAFNRRMSKKLGSTMRNYFVWNDQNQLIAITNGSGVLQSRFVYGSKSHVPDYMIKGSTRYKIISDHLGSPVVVVHSTTGAIVQQVTYDEFGNILTDTSPGYTPFGFAGCLYDTDTKLCRFGARDYDPSIGRWMDKDPIRFDGGDTNLYGYVLQDPVNYIDPEGKSAAAAVATVCVAGAAYYITSAGVRYIRKEQCKEQVEEPVDECKQTAEKNNLFQNIGDLINAGK